jgi:hypothetical protein
MASTPKITFPEPKITETNVEVADDISGSIHTNMEGGASYNLRATSACKDIEGNFGFWAFGPTVEQLIQSSLSPATSVAEFMKVTKRWNDLAPLFGTRVANIINMFAHIEKSGVPTVAVLIGDGGFSDFQILKRYLESNTPENIIGLVMCFLPNTSPMYKTTISTQLMQVLEHNKSAVSFVAIDLPLDDPTALARVLQAQTKQVTIVCPEEHVNAFNLFTFHPDVTPTEMSEAFKEKPDMVQKLMDKLLTIAKSKPQMLVAHRAYKKIHHMLKKIGGQSYLDEISLIKARCVKGSVNAVVIDELLKQDPAELLAIKKALESHQTHTLVFGHAMKEEEKKDIEKAVRDLSGTPLATFLKTLMRTPPRLTDGLEKGMMVLSGATPEQCRLAMKTFLSQYGDFTVEGANLLMSVFILMTSDIQLPAEVIEMLETGFFDKEFLMRALCVSSDGIVNDKDTPALSSPAIVMAIANMFRSYSDKLIGHDKMWTQIADTYLKKAWVWRVKTIVAQVKYQKLPTTVTLQLGGGLQVGDMCTIQPYESDPQPGLPSVVIIISIKKGIYTCIYLDRPELKDHDKWDVARILPSDMLRIVSPNDYPLDVIKNVGNFFSEKIFKIVDKGAVLKSPSVLVVHEWLKQLHLDGKDAKKGKGMLMGAKITDPEVKAALKHNIDEMTEKWGGGSTKDVVFRATVPREIMIRAACTAIGAGELLTIKLIQRAGIKMPEMAMLACRGPCTSHATSFRATYMGATTLVQVPSETILVIQEEMRRRMQEAEPKRPTASNVFGCPTCFCDVLDMEMDMYPCGHRMCKPCAQAMLGVPYVPGDLLDQIKHMCPECRKPIKSGDIKVDSFFEMNPDGITPGHAARFCTDCFELFVEPIGCGGDDNNVSLKCSGCNGPPEGSKCCPESGLPIVREGGCDHIACNCGCDSHWCWGCGYVFDAQHVDSVETIWWSCGGQCTYESVEERVNNAEEHSGSW